MSTSNGTGSSSQGQMPDYLLIGQMLDTDEKPKMYEEPDDIGQIPNDGQFIRRRMGTTTSVYSSPPEYRRTYIAASPVSPVNTNTLPISPSQITNSDASSRSDTDTVCWPVVSERFSIPTKNDALSSGFPYDRRVYDLITHDEWHLFSQEILNAAKLSFSEDAAAWTTGVTAGTLASPLILVLAPVAGYYAGRAVHRKTVVKAVRERLDRDGEIRAVLRRWNDTFKERGFEAWLELPVDSAEIQLDAKQPGPKMSRGERKVANKIAKRFKIVIVPTSGSKGYDGQELCEPSPDIPLLVEAMGNELRDPVELQHDREPVELDHITRIPNQDSSEYDDKLDKSVTEGGRYSPVVVSPVQDEQQTGIIEHRQYPVELP